MYEKKLWHLLPLIFPVPNHNFQKCNIYVTGFKAESKIEYKNMLITLGANVQFDLQNLDILICENYDCKKYHLVKEHNINKLNKYISV